MKEKFKGNNYVYWGLTAFIVIAASILLVFFLSRLNFILAVIGKILLILAPVILGILFAYLLNPLVSIVEKYITSKISNFLSKKIFGGKKIRPKFARGLAIFITLTIALLFIALVITFVIPGLLDSLNMMISNIPVYVNNIYERLKSVLETNPDLTGIVEKMNSNITDSISKIVLPSMDTILTNITTGISSFVKWTINIIIGIIVSIYLLYDKDQFVAGIKKFLRAILPKKAYEPSMSTLKSIDKVFGGFLAAKIIDSIIIGILTFIIASIFKIPYALVISVIVGITNIIPYFGPFIGAIPSALLLLLINPAKCLTFVIIIFIIQQFDGNILGPKLIGNKTGIKSFWVLFAILLFGGLFGFVGMIFGVPIFAIIYSIINNLIDKRLAKRKSL